MTPLLLRAGLRHHLRHGWQLALSLLGILLGVAVVVAVDIAAGSARRAFTASAEAVAGRATHEIVGGPTAVPESLYARLRVELGIDSIAPVIDRRIRLSDHGRSVRLLGIDPFAEPPFRPYVRPIRGDIDLSALLAHAVLLPAALADALRVTAGDTLLVEDGDAVVMAGVIEIADAVQRQALDDVVIADIATAQEITGSVGIIDRIDIRVADDAAGRARIDRIRAALPAGTQLHEAGVRAGATARLTHAFETNLTSLALVALVFGMFLIYNSVTFSIVRRRTLIGLLRAQGVTRGEVMGLVLLEALVIGVVATALGILAGLVLGRELLGLVTRTINDLYYAVSVTTVRTIPGTLVKAAVLGVGATVVAALIPAREAVRAAPRATLSRAAIERLAARNAAPFAMLGALLCAIATAIVLLSARSLTAGFAALFIVILGAALVTPAATLGFVRITMPLLGRAGAVARLAARGVAATLSRTAPAIAALATAIAVGIAVTIMIASFRTGVERWLGHSLVADIYIAAAGTGTDRTHAALLPELAGTLLGMDDVAGVTTYRNASMLVDGDIVRIMAVDLFGEHRAAFEMLRGGAAAWPAFDAGAVLISEPLAWRTALDAGDTVTLPTGHGDRGFRVAGVYRDYATEHGVVVIDRSTYTRWWNDDVVNAIAVFLQPGADADVVIERIHQLPAARNANIRPSRALRTATLDVFDRTFVITGVLQLLALLVAFIGVTSALMALQLERAREIGVLRATGLTPAQVTGLVALQTTLMGAAAAALALPLGLALAWAMVHIINRRAFGWSFELIISAPPFLQAVAVGLGAALLAALYPAWRMARTRPADALRAE